MPKRPHPDKSNLHGFLGERIFLSQLWQGEWASWDSPLSTPNSRGTPVQSQAHGLRKSRQAGCQAAEQGGADAQASEPSWFWRTKAGDHQGLPVESNVWNSLPASLPSWARPGPPSATPSALKICPVLVCARLSPSGRSVKALLKCHFFQEGLQDAPSLSHESTPRVGVEDASLVVVRRP